MGEVHERFVLNEPGAWGSGPQPHCYAPVHSRMTPLPSRRRGHSLVEILVVIAIIVIVAALTVGVIVAAKKIVQSLKRTAEGTRAEVPALVEPVSYA